MTAVNPPEEDILAKFTREYRETIPEKEKQIADLIDALRNEINLDNLKALRMHIHKIAGSAGTYGFTTVSIHCRAFEKELLDKIDHFTEHSGDPSWITGFEDWARKISDAFSAA